MLNTAQPELYPLPCMGDITSEKLKEFSKKFSKLNLIPSRPYLKCVLAPEVSVETSAVPPFPGEENFHAVKIFFFFTSNFFFFKSQALKKWKTRNFEISPKEISTSSRESNFQGELVVLGTSSSAATPFRNGKKKKKFQ